MELLYIHEVGIGPVGFIYFFFIISAADCYHQTQRLLLQSGETRGRTVGSATWWNVKVWVERPAASLLP